MAERTNAEVIAESRDLAYGRHEIDVMRDLADRLEVVEAELRRRDAVIATFRERLVAADLESEEHYGCPVMIDVTGSDAEDRLIDLFDAAFADGAARPSRSVAPSAASDRHLLESAVGAVVWNASNHPNPVAVLGRDITPMRTKIVDAVLAAGFVRPAAEGSTDRG